MKHLFTILSVPVLVLFFSVCSFAQCGNSTFCNGNTGLYSNDDATSIAYDNFGSGYHANFVKEPNSVWKVWGANMSNTGGDVYSPLSFTVANYPALTGNIYKMAISSTNLITQLIVLTSTGLFAIGDSGAVLSPLITTSTDFHKITVDGKTDGLPANVSPVDVKMLFASSHMLMITTCTGEVYVLSQSGTMIRNGSTTQWSQVMENSTTPLTNVIVSRGQATIGYALKSDGTLWTWGAFSSLGNGTAVMTRYYATAMTLPAGLPGIKMIQCSSEAAFSAYYILGTDKKVYSLGRNAMGVLGDRTFTDRTTWVNAKNPDNSIITDAAWISANEHESSHFAFSVIRAGGIFYTAGFNGYSMIGNSANFLYIPAGISATDVITHAEIGGHFSTAIKLGSPRYGYVGHRVNGSMGDGNISLDDTQTTFDFITPPIIAVCGTICTSPVLTTNSPLCPGSTAIFTITGTPGDIVTYSLNSAASQTITIGAAGSVTVTVTNAQTNQNMQLSYVLGATGSCSNVLTDTAIISVSGVAAPIFTQVPGICTGAALSLLPLTSNNGIAGTWSPAINNMQTTLYTFTPSSGNCVSNTTMTIQVNPANLFPAFTQVAAICSGQALSPLPVISNNGISGSWSPALNNTQTTAYTFTPIVNTCAATVVMTIQVNPNNTPVFTQVAPIAQGGTLNPLPTTSNNGIAGSWAPAVNNQATTTYTFSPVASSCSGEIQMTIIVTGTTPVLCGDSTFCNGNTGLYSNDIATDIAYDNMGSGYHGSYIKEPNSVYKVWGADNSNTATSVLSPLSITVANYPALTGVIYKVIIGSNFTSQLFVLTSTGLFAVGDSGAVISNVITTLPGFQKITVNGKTDGLPANVGPLDVKMLFATTGTLMITTCSGEVYVLSQNPQMRGNGGVGSALVWAQVMETLTTPLTNVIVSRGSASACFALKADGTLWTWGKNTYLGDGTAGIVRNFATAMTMPAGIPGIKMIQSTSSNGNFSSYYVLGTDKKVYSLGSNSFGELGDRTSTGRSIWVNCKNPNNTIITDAAWISSNEHDTAYPGFAVIKAGGVFYTGGNNSYSMVGRTAVGGVNYLDLPAGISATDVITHAEVGGHSTAVIRLGSIRYGYVGHRINGSMGDGSSQDMTQTSFDFITPPIVAVCGTLCVAPTITTNGPICPGGNAIFTITGTPGDIISYALNGGATQTIAIGAGGTITVTATNVASNQSIMLSYVLGATGSCSNSLSTASVVNVNGTVVPLFTQVPPICLGGTLAALPLTSLNGIIGTWSPAIDDTQTTVYTFTGTAGGPCTSSTPATMTISVFPPNTAPTFTQAPPICVGQTMAALPTTSNNGVVGSWSPAIDNTVTTTYTFTPATMACITTGSMTVQVLPAQVPTFTQVAPICQGDVLNALPLISTNLISGSWAPAPNNNLTTTYTFTPALNSCASVIQMTILVNLKVTPTFVQAAAICEGTVMTALPLLSVNGISGSWAPALNNTVTTTYTFTPTLGICAYTAPMTITVIPKIMPLFATPADVCFGDIVFSLPPVSQNGVTGTWLPAFNNTLSGTYTFTPAATECALPASMQILVFDDFDFEYSKYCENGSLILGIVPKFDSFDLSTSTFNWQFNNVTVGSNSLFNVTAYLNSTVAVEILPISFTSIVTDANGCVKTKSIGLDNVYCDIQRGISPNSDGFNEFFDLRLLDVKHLSIFNRYGVKVYSKEGYYNEWVGQTDDGKILPDATYYYLIEFDNGDVKTGWIYINKEH